MLELTFGVRDVALQWFSSYLLDRCQTVSVNGSTSKPSCLLYGVPQGSVLGPVLFTLYSQPMSDVILQNNCAYHKYADDTKLSQSNSLPDFPTTKLSVQSCVSDLHSG